MQASAERRPRWRSRRCRNLETIPFLVLALASPAQAADSRAESLVHLINDFRASAPACADKRTPKPGPLAPAPVLSGLKLVRGADLQALLKAAGYHAARAQAIVLSGPRSASRAMELLVKQYCVDIARGSYADIGVAREGSTWRIVLAQPLLASDLGGWREAGRDILRLTNEARSVGRSCGQQSFAAAAPLHWNGRLAEAARTHSADMARRNTLSHVGTAGRRAGARADVAGYDWRAIGENIATGQGSPERVVAGWLASPTHCTNVMDSRFTEMGAAYALNMETDTGIFWTQVFGAPR